MAQSITLTASMRSNLASLKSIQSQMDTTQNRLSTGKKVNSAIDNASSFYQARALSNRASDLDSLLDSMGQGIQTIQAANEGIESVTAFVEQLKSISTSAFALDPTTDTYEDSIASYKKQFSSIITEMKKLIDDSSYQGINLLKGGKLTVTFNETRSNRFTVQGDTIFTEMNIADETTWVQDNPQAVTNSEVFTTKKTIAADTEGATSKYTHGGVDYVKDGTDFYNIATGEKVTDADLLDNINGIPSETPAALTTAVTVKTGTIAANAGTMYKNGNLKAIKDASGDYYDTTTGLQITDATGYTAMTTGSYANSIDATLDSLSVAVDYLRSYATELGNNYSIIETRQNFTSALIDVLETGADNLVLADMNEESANYLALQTRQQLAINSLSLASQSAQSVLKLF